jgi:hypothetical protein
MRETMEFMWVKVVTRREVRKRALIRSKERIHIHREVARYWQIAKRFNAEVMADGLDESAAGELFAAIHDHGARAAHADTAREAEGEIGTRPALQGEQRVEDAGLVAELDVVRFEASRLRVSCAPLDADGDFGHRANRRGARETCNGFG